MADSDLRITLAADAAGVVQGVDQAKSAIAGVGPRVAALAQSFSDLGKSLQGGLDGLRKVSSALADAAKGAGALQGASGAVRSFGDAVAGVGRGASPGRPAGAEQAVQDQQAITDAVRQGVENRTDAVSQGAAEQLAAIRAGTRAQLDAVKEAEAAGLLSRGQATAETVALYRRQGEAELQAAQAGLHAQIGADAEKLNSADAGLAQTASILSRELAAYGAYAQKRISIEADTQHRIAMLNTQTLSELRRQWQGLIGPVVSQFNSGLLQLAEGTKSFRQVMAGLGQQLLEDFMGKVVDRMVTGWLTNLAAMTAAKASTNATMLGLDQTYAALSRAFGAETAKKDLLSSAAQAAGAAFASASHVPLIGWLLGPAAAAAAFAGALAFDGYISAAGGVDIPAGANPLARLHAQEMVLPARLANPLRDMLAGVSARQGGGGPGGEVHNHTHNWSVTAMDGPSVERFLRLHGDRMVKVLNERVRANAGVALGYAR